MRTTAAATQPIQPTREQVLAQCVAAAERWAQAPGRNLVLLFDGTGNILGNKQDTNVVKLLRLLTKHSPDAPQRPAQLVYYDPGVGTTNEFPAASIASKLAGLGRRLKGLALGSGAFDNIAQAYEFLAGNHQPGDRIFLFGFSRGAFTARAVGGMVNMYGLVHAQGLPMIHTLVRNYFARPSPDRAAFSQDVIDNFSLGRTPLVHLVGVWDTVETIGSSLLGGVSITNSKDFERKRFVHVRHALSLHETRSKYKPRGYTAPTFTAQEASQRSFDERWFRGVHSDVGGSYERDGLSNVALAWMIAQAQGCGLLLDKPNPHVPNPAAAMHDQTLDSPFWAWTGMNARERNAQTVIDPTAQPVAGATPAQRSSGGWKWQLGGWVLFAAVVACLCLDLDWALFTAVALWLAYPVAWALRRLAARAIVGGGQISWPARNAHWWLRGFALAGVAQHLLAWCAPHWAVAIAWLCHAQLGLLAVLALVWMLGAAAVRPGGAKTVFSSSAGRDP